MVTRNEAITQTDAWKHLKSSLDILIRLEKNDEGGQEENENIARLYQAASYIQNRMLNSDLSLISNSTLIALNNHLNNLNSSLSQYEKSRSTNFLSSSIDEVDQALINSAQLPSISWESLDENVRNAVESLPQKFSELNEFSERANNTIDRFDIEVKERWENLDQTIKSRTEIFEEATETLEKRIETEVQRLDKTISEYSQQFNSAEQQRVSSFSETENQRRSQSEERIRDQREHWTRLVDEQKKAQEDIVTKAREILGITAASTTAGAYVNEADMQKHQADIWRWIAATVFAIAIIVATVTLLLLKPDEGSLSNIVFFYASRTTIVIAIGVFAGFAARESSQHRSRERESKRFANELTTFRPFLSEIDETQRNELIKEASSRYFPGHLDRINHQAQPEVYE